MNRRDFCLTAGSLLAGAALCSAATCYCEGRSARFRAQKVFLESWDAENVWKDSPQTASFVRKKLEIIRRNAYNGLLLVPKGRGVSGWMNKIVREADDFNLKVFVPVCLTRGFFRNIRAVTPLSYRTGVLQSTDGISHENDGLLLLNGIGDVFGLVLYDSSRYLWSGFALPASGFGQNTESGVNDSRLMTAKWLDHVILRETKSMENNPCTSPPEIC